MRRGDGEILERIRDAVHGDGRHYEDCDLDDDCTCEQRAFDEYLERRAEMGR